MTQTLANTHFAANKIAQNAMKSHFAEKEFTQNAVKTHFYKKEFTQSIANKDFDKIKFMQNADKSYPLAYKRTASLDNAVFEILQPYQTPENSHFD